jgi:hypothetical protein
VADSAAQQVNDALYHLYSDEPLEDCLRECIAVGVAFRDDELIGWARRELAGYPRGAQVPDYRFATVRLIGVERGEQSETTGPVGFEEFDTSNFELVTGTKNAVPWSIDDIAKSVTQADENHQLYIVVSLIASADKLLKEGHRSYAQVYWGVLRDNLDGILQEVRNVGITKLKALSTNSEPIGVGTQLSPVSRTAGSLSPGHAFISYVREDSGRVDALQKMLEAAGIPVWRDTASLWPGEDWRVKIRDAISRDALVFIACFSHHTAARQRSYQNEELLLAIDQLRRRRPDDPWLIPVRFDDCDIPDFELHADRTLASIHRADLFGPDSDLAARRLVEAVQRLLR